MRQLKAKGDHFSLDALHIFVLGSFAVAQPIYDLIGRNPELLVAHRMGAGLILGFVVALSIGIPAIFVLLDAAAGLVGHSTRRLVHRLILLLLAVAFVAPLVGSIPRLPSGVAIALSLALGAGLVAAYERLAAVRSFMTVVAPSIVVFPVILLTTTPVSQLLWPNQRDPRTVETTSRIKNASSVIFIVFDEFEASSLLDEKRNIDEVRFPSLAALARDSWWFPRAATVWTETQRAVPAILTGLRPHDPKALPDYRSHPNNLFTWLGANGYRMRVTEPLMTLCPPELCPPTAEGNSSTFDPTTFASDLAVLYLHIVLPADIANTHLPRMDGGWKGFAMAARGSEPERGMKDFRAEFRGVISGDRRTQFRSLLQGIQPGEKPTLHFLHILLPHHPYEFLPDGTIYPGGNVAGLIGKSWVQEEQLPKLAYQRYLMQVGLVDKLVGELVARLKSTGMYDSSLVVLTADHGQSFRPGAQKRSLSMALKDHAADVLQVPLLMKLPNQRQAHRSDRNVLTVDILPTIADALGTTLPWATDGQSMIGSDFPEREVTEIRSVSDPAEAIRFTTSDVTNYPGLQWKIDTFGSRTPLADMSIADPNQSLIGQRVSDVSTTDESASVTLELDQQALFADVRLNGGMIPALLQGQVIGATPGETMHIAIALNGTFVATTRTTAWAGRPHFFSAMLPVSRFKEGTNVLDVFRIHDLDNQTGLSRISLPSVVTFTLSTGASGRGTFTRSDGHVIPVVSGAVRGQVDTVKLSGQRYEITGWAADTKRVNPVKTVVLFNGDRQIAAGAPRKQRPDIAALFDNQRVLAAGFQLSFPKELFKRELPLRAFGITEDEFVSELAVNGSVAKVVQAKP